LVREVALESSLGGHNGGEDIRAAHEGPKDGPRGRLGDQKRRTEERMVLNLSLFNNSVTTLLDHLTNYYGEEATLETYLICARVKSSKVPGGSGINWIVSPGGEELAGGLLREVLKAVEANGDGDGQN